MTAFSSATSFGDFDVEARTRRANRRRLVVFAAVFAVVAIAGLVYVFSRPAVYESTARIDFATPGIERLEANAAASDKPFALRDEVQYLTSRPLLATVWDQLKTAGVPAPERFSLGDPVLTLQAMLVATPLEGTRVVVLRARGGQPAFLAAFVDRVVASYQESLATRYRVASSNEIDDIGDEAKKLQDAVVAKRREADAFRARYNIVSVERDENQVLAEVKGTSAALTKANDAVASAEAKLKSVEEAQASGQAVTRSRDDPTLAALEQQANAIRADLREVARTFTPQYMAIDPRVKAQRERLAETEQAIVAQRQTSQKAALQEAREQLSSARATATSLRGQLAANQQSVQSFTTRFAEYQAMQEELKRIEVLRQKAVERYAALDAGNNARRPQVKIVEQAAVPNSPVSPWYARDAAIALAAALLAALAAMGIVELFNRPPPRPATVVVPQTWSAMPLGAADPSMHAALGHRRDAMLLDGSSAGVATPAALAGPASLPRELGDAELVALVDASEPALRRAIALLASGLAPDETVALRRGQLDDQGATIGTRHIALAPSLLASIPPGEPDAPVVPDRDGRAMSAATLDARLLYAAHDAGIADAESVNAAAVHHTYALFLVRQGIRFVDLAAIVGDLDADRLAAYGRLAPAGPRRALDTIERTHPAFRTHA